MQFSRIDFRPIAASGDDVTGALKKLDINFGELGDQLSPQGSIGLRLGTLEAGIAALGSAARKDVGQTAGSVAAGDDIRFSMQTWRNVLINADFDIWQRGTSISVPASSARYLADRWQVQTKESTVDVARVSLAAGVPTFAGSGRFALKATVASAGTSTSYAVLSQSIENIASLEGGKATLSFWILASTPAAIGVELVQAGSSSVVTGIGSRQFAVGTSNTWIHFSTTIDVPVAPASSWFGGKLQLIFWMDAGAQNATRSGGIGSQSATFWFSQVQLEKGDRCTEFERRPLAVEQRLCERYYQKSFNIDQDPTSNVSAQPRPNMIYADTGVVATVPLHDRMRVPPAVTFWGSSTVPGAGNNWVLLTGNGWQSGQTAAFIVNETEFSCTTIYPGGGFNTIKSIYVQGGWTADAEF